MGNLSIIFDNICDRPLLALLGLFFAYLLGDAIYNLWFHPLAQYPGPFFAKISSLPNLYHALSGYRHVWIWQLHQIYGLVTLPFSGLLINGLAGNAVRYRPNSIVFNSPNAYSAIYNYKVPVKRGIMHKVWAVDERWESTLSHTEPKTHSKMRKALSGVFSESALLSAEEYVVKHVDRWVELLISGNRETWSKSKNIAEWTDRLILDIGAELFFGASLNTKEEGSLFEHLNTARSHGLQFLYTITQLPFMGLIAWLKPRGLDVFLYLIMPRAGKLYLKFIEDSVQKRIESEEREIQNHGTEGERAHRDMFHYLFNAKNPESGAPAVSRKHLLGESGFLFTASVDTTSATLTGFFFYVTRNERVFGKLNSEIRSSFSSVDEIRWGPTLSSLPYLRACIYETMRLCPAICTDLDREVLVDMDVDSWPVSHGAHISCSQWCIPRNEDNFPDVNVFRPERFIVDEKAGVTSEDVARANKSFFPFSTGPASCLGKNLAILQLSVSIARALYRMDVRGVVGDRVGEGSAELGWGRSNKGIFQLRDGFVALRTGPMVQFRERQV